MIAGRVNSFSLGSQVSRLAWVGVLSVMFLGGAWIARAADEAAPQGLAGIVPQVSPADLIGALQSLPEHWEPWGTAVTGDLANLFEQTPADIDGQKKAIAQLRKREATAAQYLADPRYRGLSTQLLTLKGGLKRRLDLADAVLATLTAGPEAASARKAEARQSLINATNALANNLNTYSTGAGWRKFLKVNDVIAAANARNDEQLAKSAAEVQTVIAGKDAITDEKAREFMNRADIAAFEKAAQRLTAANNPVNANSPEVRQACTDLLASLESFEETKGSDSAKLVRDTYAKLNQIAADGGTKITNALRENYFNYNVRVFAPESFINRFVSETRQDSSGINEAMDEAMVTGAQTTVSTVGVDVQPSNNGALMYLVVNGNVASNTTASTDQANVAIYGTANFTAQKALVFDGEKFSVGQTAVGANARNTVTGLNTRYDGIPLIGGIARNQAYNIAGSKAAEGESTVIGRVRSEVATRLDNEINREFGPSGELPRKLNERLAALREEKLMPQTYAWTSTNTDVRMVGRLMDLGELGGNTPDPSLNNPRGITLLLHESALNNGIDRLGFAGQTLTDDQMRDKLKGHLEKVLGREVDMGSKPKNVSAESAARLLSFDTIDPIRFQAVDGTLTLTIRAGLSKEGMEEVPTQIVTVPLKLTVVNEGINLEPGAVSVAPAEKPDNATTQISRAGVIKKKIEEAIPKQQLKRSMTVDRGNRRFTLAITRIMAVDGWLSVWIE